MRRLIAGAGAVIGTLALGLLGAVPAQAADTTYSYKVVVKSAGGSVIPDVWVSLDADTGYGWDSGTTDATGTFTATDLEAGAYKIEVDNPLDYSKPITTTATVGGATTSTTVTVAGAQLVSGKVTNTAGTALSQVSVSLAPVSGSKYGYAQTATDGTFHAVVPAGSYRVSFSHYDSATSTTDYGSMYYPNTYDYSKASTVKVTAGKDQTLSTVKLAKNGKITGKVTIAGKAASNAYVSMDATNGAYGYATTDANGAFSTVAPPGTYKVYAYPSDTGAWLRTYAGNTVREPDAAAVKIADGATATVSIAAVAGATVKGKVVDKNGKAVKGADVYASNKSRAGSAYGTTDSSGNYVLRGLATGSVQVTAYKGSANGTKTVTAKQGSTVTAKTISAKTVGGAITAKIKVTNGSLTSTQVALLDSKARPLTSTTPDKSGKVKFSSLPKGTYYVTISGTNVSKKVKVTTKSVSAGTIKAAKFTTVKGSVKTAANKAAKGSYVYLYDKYGAYAGYAKVSSKGTYSITRGVSGKYTVTVAPASTSDATVSSSVTVKKGKSLTKNLKLAKAGKLTGTVKNSKGKAVAGLYVSGASWATTSTSGKYTLGGFKSGSTTLYVSDPYTGGYRDKTVKATAKAGKTVTVKTITVS